MVCVYFISQVPLFLGFRHLVPKNSRTRFLDHLVPVRDGGTKWPLVVEDSTGWMAEVSRLVRDGWQKFPAGTRWLAEILLSSRRDRKARSSLRRTYSLALIVASL